MTSVVHDRKKYPHSTQQRWRKRASRHSKLDLDQTSMAHTHTERHIRDQTQFSVANFSLDDSDDICDPE